MWKNVENKVLTMSGAAARTGGVNEKKTIIYI